MGVKVFVIVKFSFNEGVRVFIKGLYILVDIFICKFICVILLFLLNFLF